MSPSNLRINNLEVFLLLLSFDMTYNGIKRQESVPFTASLLIGPRFDTMVTGIKEILRINDVFS